MRFTIYILFTTTFLLLPGITVPQASHLTNILYNGIKGGTPASINPPSILQQRQIMLTSFKIRSNALSNLRWYIVALGLCLGALLYGMVLKCIPGEPRKKVI
jgi:hypothetical protein